ncbi:MAG TPA: DUF2786 domain-containing protein [Kofleriaceae bacterium]|nr:DUF2786 domain-containing protein [Kofleriaceae bacterium]
MDTPLSAALEAALVREVQRAYEWQSTRFRGLVTPVIKLVDSSTRLGRWVPSARTLELSRMLVLARPWPEVMGVLEHEMAHQYVDEVLRVTDEAPHGPTFGRVCAERGIDARAAGAPVPGAAAEIDRTLERIRKLLALAGSDNQHEAEIAMRTAHELMLRYNIEHVGAPREFEIAHVGDPTKRSNRVEIDIVSLLAELFFVKVIRIPVYLPSEGRHGGVYELAGTRANVDMACHVYAFLLATAWRLWDANRADARVRSGRDRLSYQSGVIRGFRDRLVAERTVLRGTGLVWRGDGKLDSFYRARHPHIVSRSRSVRVTGAHDAGREAGRKVVLHKPVSSAVSRGRLLGG